jgi:hypothetical protein
MTDHYQAIEYLNKIRALDFVSDAKFGPAPDLGKIHPDGMLKIRTPKRSYIFIVETKRSYLDSSTLNAIISHANVSSDATRHPVLLFARYVPEPSAERLIHAGINFVDLAGNMHLALNNDYVRTVIGKKEDQRYSEKIVTPARIQFLFVLAAQPEATTWTVRRLADAAGISKSNAAKIRQQLIVERFLTPHKNGWVVDAKELEEQLVRGYERVLRPRILVGRFRAQEATDELLIDKFKQVFREASIDWSLTGGPAASLLQHFYKGVEMPIFVGTLTDNMQRELRVLPDRTGPLIFLRSFGPLTRWKKTQGIHIAHPWLIFTELMLSEDPRAHEAAVNLKGEFLSAT